MILNVLIVALLLFHVWYDTKIREEEAKRINKLLRIK